VKQGKKHSIAYYVVYLIKRSWNVQQRKDTTQWHMPYSE